LRNILIQLGLHGLILRNEVLSHKLQGGITGHFGTIIAFEDKYENGIAHSIAIIEKLKAVPRFPQNVSYKYNIIPGTYTNKRTIRGVAIAERNISVPDQRDESTRNQYYLFDPSFTQRTLHLARQIVDDYIMPVVEMASPISKAQSPYSPFVF
jgi:hypothetical protein